MCLIFANNIFCFIYFCRSKTCKNDLRSPKPVNNATARSPKSVINKNWLKFEKNAKIREQVNKLWKSVCKNFGVNLIKVLRETIRSIEYETFQIYLLVYLLHNYASIFWHIDVLYNYTKILSIYLLV